MVLSTSFKCTNLHGLSARESCDVSSFLCLLNHRMNDCIFHRALRHEPGHTLNVLGMIFTVPSVILDFPQKANSGGKKKKKFWFRSYIWNWQCLLCSSCHWLNERTVLLFTSFSVIPRSHVSYLDASSGRKRTVTLWHLKQLKIYHSKVIISKTLFS